MNVSKGSISSLALFLSGAAALGNEVVWSRALAPIAGSSTWAQASTLAAFMGGLALGYAAAGRRVSDPSQGARWYVVAELLVACFALAIPYAAPLVASGLDGAGVQSAAVRISVSVLLALAPAVAMGTTLPALVTAAGASPSQAARWGARLYAANNAGAVLGAWLAGMWALGAFGMRATSWGTAAASVAAAALVAGALPAGRRAFDGARSWPLFHRGPTTLVAGLPTRPPRRQSAAPAPSDAARGAPGAGIGPLLACSLGAIALLCQSAWLRLAGITLGSSVYAFSGVVGVTIGALALGSALASSALERADAEGAHRMSVWAGLAQVGALLLALVFAPRIPWLLAWAKSLLPPTGGGYAAYLATCVALTAGVAAPAAFTSGLWLPLIQRAWDPDRRAGASVGVYYGANSAGAVLAAISAPLLLPMVGLEGLVRLAAIASLAVAIGSVVWTPKRRSAAGPRVWIAVALGAAALAWPVRFWSPVELSAGEFRHRRASVGSWSEWRESAARASVRFHRDGPVASVTVVERGRHLSMRINGKADASNAADMLTQVTSAHIPLTVRSWSDPSVLVVGLGSGVTATSAALHTSDVRVVELSPAVSDAAALFAPDHATPLEGIPVHVADGRQWLAGRCGAGERFDVVISEPSNPWVAGNGSLFTAEFFELVQRCTTEQGVLAQWFHLYEMSDELVYSVLGTVLTAFPYAQLWEMHPNDILVVASKAPFPDQWPAEEKWRAISADLYRVRVQSVAALLSRQMMGNATMQRVRELPHRIHRDDWPFLETDGPRALFADLRATGLRKLDQRAIVGGDTWLLSSGFLAPPEGRQSVVETDSWYPGAPAARRRGLLESLVEDGDASFWAHAIYSLADDPDDWRMLASWGPRLVERFPSAPRVLFGLARAARLHPELASSIGTAEALATSCVALGDEPNGRCARMLR